MTIEEALRRIAGTEPTYASEVDGSTWCVYCHGEDEWNEESRRHEFVHTEQCSWWYLKKTVEEDLRIELELLSTYPQWAAILKQLKERRVK